MAIRQRHPPARNCIVVETDALATELLSSVQLDPVEPLRARALPYHRSALSETVSLLAVPAAKSPFQLQPQLVTRARRDCESECDTCTQ